MSLSIGIVGLPNVGKSTLFNALLKEQLADAANFPFCTIEPNTGIVTVPDERLIKISDMVKPQKLIPATVEFVDIAGLVKGAAQGEGLGNKFLANIRECDAIVHVLRNFEDSEVTHVEGDVNMVRDMEIIESELILADLASLEKRLEKFKKEKNGAPNDKEILGKEVLYTKLKEGFESGVQARNIEITTDEKPWAKELFLLTIKPVIYVVNIAESDAGNFETQEKEARDVLKSEDVIALSAQVESEVLGLADSEQQEYLESLGLTDPGLDRLIRLGYKTLGLMSYFTAGEKEVRAWTVRIGSTAPVAAGEIHTDFEKNFIRAEVISYDDYIELGGESGAKEKGKMRVEGKEYIVQDADVVYFRIGG